MQNILDAISEIKIIKTTSVVEKLQLLVSILSIFHKTEHLYPKSTEVYDGQSFDFIIVGGGTAGCVLANRLTETNASVLLVEAGDLPPFISDVPGFFPIANAPDINWNFRSMNDGYTSQELKSWNLNLIQGKMLGGSSGLDYLLYQRGFEEDYNKWVEIGNEDWEWEKVLPYFKKAEITKSKAILKTNSSCLHGTEGYLGVTQLDNKDKVEKFLKSFKEQGHKLLDDSNGYQLLGYFEPQVTIDDDIRQSTAVSYIRPIKDRPNLHLILNTNAIKIIFKNKEAIGIEIKQKDKDPIIIKANKEVLISAGAINTPKLLIISGIGPKEQLEKLKIHVVHDSTFVGKNLHDHPIVMISITGETDLLSQFDNLDVLKHIKTFPTPVIIGRVALDKKQKVPDYEVNVLPLPASSGFPSVFCDYVIGIETKICGAQSAAGLKKESLFAVSLLLHPKSRGHLEIISKDHRVPPLIYPNYFSEKDDLELFAKCIENYVSVINTTYFIKHNGQVVDLKLKACEKNTFLSREYWKCYILNLVTTSWDLAGTCSMGNKDKGVVDSRFRVHGVKKLRVIDSSVIPTTISGNIKAPVIMLAERGADMVKADNGYIKKENK